jgi:hypothetical protein
MLLDQSLLMLLPPGKMSDWSVYDEIGLRLQNRFTICITRDESFIENRWLRLLLDLPSSLLFHNNRSNQIDYIIEEKQREDPPFVSTVL